MNGIYLVKYLDNGRDWGSQRVHAYLGEAVSWALHICESETWAIVFAMQNKEHEQLTVITSDMDYETYVHSVREVAIIEVVIRDAQRPTHPLAESVKDFLNIREKLLRLMATKLQVVQ